MDPPLDVVLMGSLIQPEGISDLSKDPIGKDPLGLVVALFEGFEHGWKGVDNQPILPQ